MRHIGFDESTVLGEYARIANTQGIVKVAETEKPTKPQVTRSSIAVDILKRVNAIKDELLKIIPNPELRNKLIPLFIGETRPLIAYKSDLAPITGIKPIDGKGPGLGAMPLGLGTDPNKKFVGVVTDMGKRLAGQIESVLSAEPVVLATLKPKLDFLRTLGPQVMLQIKSVSTFNPEAKAEDGFESTAADLQAQWAKARKELEDGFANANKKLKGREWTQSLVPHYQSVLTQVIKKYPKELTPYINNYARQLAPNVLGKAAEANNDLSKQADGKLYDISGETGEQLIDSAHPGGGTRTELSHSKTNENLVETIVEQQKRDVEVAKSVPKGTYAALVKLHNQLNKMGHGKLLSPLRDAILRVARVEDIVSGALVSLADKLDDLGYERSANKVDGLIKSAGAFEWYTGYNPIEALWDRLEDIDKSSEPPLSQWIQHLKQMQNLMQNIPIGKTPEEVQKIETNRAKLLNNMVSQLGQLQGVYNTIKERGEIQEWGSDDTEFEKQLQTTTQALQQEAQRSQQKAQQAQKSATSTEEEPSETSKGEPGKKVKKEEEAKKMPFKKRLLADEAFARKWAGKFNRQFTKIIRKHGFEKNSDLPTNLHYFYIKTGANWPSLQKSLQRILGEWSKAGAWDQFMTKIDAMVAEAAKGRGGPSPEGEEAPSAEPGSTERINEIFRAITSKYNEVLRREDREPRFPPLRRRTDLHRLLSTKAREIARREMTEGPLDDAALRNQAGYIIEMLGKEDPTKFE